MKPEPQPIDPNEVARIVQSVVEELRKKEL